MPEVMAALTSEAGQRAVASGEPGAIVQVVRKALGVNQTQLARRAGYSQPTISRVERGLNRDETVLTDLADTLGVPPEIFSGIAATPTRLSTVQDVDRREFLGGTIAVASAALLPASIIDAVGTQRVDSRAIAQSEEALRRLQELEAQHGGNAVYELTANMAQRLQTSLGRASYSPAIGTRLRYVTAAAAECAGWRAYDAGEHELARRWWLETLAISEVGSGAQDHRVLALAGMSKAAADRKNGRDAVAYAQASAAAASGRQTPGLMSMLAAREAIGHSVTGDRTTARTTLTKAKRLLDKMRPGSEPEWLSFWGASDLAAHEMRCARLTNDFVAAERHAREAVTFASDDTMPRNRALYSAYLANALARGGQLDESISLARGVLRHSATQGSGRIRSELRSTARFLARQAYEPARVFAASAQRLLQV